MTISLKAIPGATTKHSWLSFTQNLISTAGDLYPQEIASRTFGQWEMAAVAAAVYGPTNYAAAVSLAGKVVKATDEGKETFLRMFHSVWTGKKEEGVALTDEQIKKHHAAVKALWSAWLKTPEGVEAMAKRSQKAGISEADPFASALASGKAKGAAQTATREQRQLRSAESAADAAQARLAAIRAKIAPKSE